MCLSLLHFQPCAGSEPDCNYCLSNKYTYMQLRSPEVTRVNFHLSVPVMTFCVRQQIYLLSLFVQVPERECCWGSLCCCGFSCGFKPLTHDWAGSEWAHARSLGSDSAVCFTGGFPLQTAETEVSGCCYFLFNQHTVY